MSTLTGRLSRTAVSRGLVLAATAAIVAVATERGGAFIVINSLVTGAMLALVAAGLALAFGVMNVPNFAQGEFFMVGTLAAFLSHRFLSESLGTEGFVGAMVPLLTIGFATLVGAALGVLVDRSMFAPLRRRSREEWVMNTFVITVGLSIVLINVHQLVWGTDYKGIFGYWVTQPVEILNVPVGFDRLMAVLIAAVAIAALMFLLRCLPAGRSMRAVAQDEAGAMLMGIDINRTHMLTLAISSALAALAGAALLFMFPSFPSVGVQPLYLAWTVVILAGLGTIGGAIVGGFVLAFLQTSASYFVGAEWQNVIPFTLIIVILLLRPHGLFGREVRGIWEQ
jgi:branched-chain amino acid transport system permease protein